MDDKIKKHYTPMSETAFYILLSLLEERHGYAIISNVEKLTNKRITLGAGTLYGSLLKMKNDKLISCIKEENNRKIYLISELGKEILDVEVKRIRELYYNSKGYKQDEQENI